jgi:hypothetical protein
MAQCLEFAFPADARRGEKRLLQCADSDIQSVLDRVLKIALRAMAARQIAQCCVAKR